MRGGFLLTRQGFIIYINKRRYIVIIILLIGWNVLRWLNWKRGMVLGPLFVVWWEKFVAKRGLFFGFFFYNPFFIFLWISFLYNAFFPKPLFIIYCWNVFIFESFLSESRFLQSFFWNHCFLYFFETLLFH